MLHRQGLPASFLRALSVVVVGTLQAGCVISGAEGRYVEREERRFPVDGKPDVKLMTRDGAIEVRSWDRSEVLVVIEKHTFSKQAVAAIRVESDQNGSQVSVDVKIARETLSGLFWGNTGSAKLIVSVPASSDIQSTTGDGAIDLDGIGGTISLRSGDGSISARNASGTLAARSGDGSIRLDAVKGAVDVNTGDGSIVVNGALTGVRARSGDGSIAVHAQAGSTTDTDWDISSGDGSVTVEVPESFGAELEARTGDGRVHFEGVTLSNVAGEIAPNHANGRLGAGGHAMRVRTGDGSILIKRLSVP
jgi:DUF4097 and DUF4098 domain-containing protein YvlB